MVVLRSGGQANESTQALINVSYHCLGHDIAPTGWHRVRVAAEAQKKGWAVCKGTREHKSRVRGVGSKKKHRKEIVNRVVCYRGGRLQRVSFKETAEEPKGC